MPISRSSRSFFFVVLTSAAAIASVGNASATSVTSTTFNGWKAALTGSPTEADFGPVSSSGSYSTASGVTLNAIGNSSLGFSFTGPDNGGYQMTGATLQGFPALAGSSDAGAGLNIAMPGAGVNAFLLSIGTSGSTPITITLSDGGSFMYSGGLFGISISHPISSLLLTTSAGSQVLINDFYFGTSNLAQDPIGGGTGGGLGGTDVTPSAEVATWLMMAGGCLVLFGAFRRFGAAASL